MRTVKIKDVVVDDVVDVLKKGGLIIYPTETLYGAGVDATNPDSVRKLNSFKKRPAGKPYSVAVSDIKMAGEYVEINRTARNIYKSFLPGPVTVISKGKGAVAKGVESETGTLGIRIPDHKLITSIIKKFGRPITATSANASYKKRPYKISDILENITIRQINLIDLVIDAGELALNDPSTVIDTTGDDLTTLRQGKIFFSKGNQIMSRSDNDTKNFAKELWQKYQKFQNTRAIIFALTGEMGAGKTIFTKGLAKAMDINEIITSPTFNLQNAYRSSVTGNRLLHIDTWRISEPSEINDLDFVKSISDRSVVAIEWADKIVDEIKRHKEDAVIIWVKIEFCKKENERKIGWKVAN